MSTTAIGNGTDFETDRANRCDSHMREVPIPADPVGDRICRLGAVDDHDVMIAGLRSLLADYGDVRLEAGARTVDQLLSGGTALDVVLLDLRLADGSVPEANIQRLAEAGVKVLVYTSGEDPYLMRSALRAGAGGVILKSESVELIVGAIRQIYHDGNVMGTDLALAIDGDEDFTNVHLSPQQRRVLELYASGETVGRVGRMTGLSVDTVNGYLMRIRQKYAQAGRPAQTKTELLKRALEDGWLPIPRVARRWQRGVAPGSA